MEEAKNKEKKTEKTDEKEKEKGQQSSAKDKDKKEEQELVSLWGFFSFNYVLTMLPRSLLFCLSHGRFDNMVEQAKFTATIDWNNESQLVILFLNQANVLLICFNSVVALRNVTWTTIIVVSI